MKKNDSSKKNLFILLTITVCTMCSFHYSQDEFFYVQQHLPGIYIETKNMRRVGETDIDQSQTDPVCRQNKLRINASGTYQWKNSDCLPSFQRQGRWILDNATDLLIDGVLYNLKFSPDAKVLTLTDPAFQQVRVYKRQ